MNLGDEAVDPKVIAEIVQKVVAKLGRRGQPHDDGYTKSTRHIVRREIHGEIHGLDFGHSSDGILQSGGQKSETHIIELLIGQNQRFDSFDRRLERTDRENDELRNRISGLERENMLLKDTVSRLEEKITLFEQDIKGLLDKEEKRVFKE